jgi:hypothetical protein
VRRLRIMVLNLGNNDLLNLCCDHFRKNFLFKGNLFSHFYFVYFLFFYYILNDRLFFIGHLLTTGFFPSNLVGSHANFSALISWDDT